MPPDPQVETSRIEGEPVVDDVDEVFTIYEVVAAGQAQGANVIATTELQEAIRSFLEEQDFTDVPDPAGLPTPRNFD
jgi:hypothetical protein